MPAGPRPRTAVLKLPQPASRAAPQMHTAKPTRVVGVITCKFPQCLLRQAQSEMGIRHARISRGTTNNSRLMRGALPSYRDVLRLDQARLLDPEILKNRYDAELRPYLLSKLPWHDKTLELLVADGVGHRHGAPTPAPCRTEAAGTFLGQCENDIA